MSFFFSLSLSSSATRYLCLITLSSLLFSYSLFLLSSFSILYLSLILSSLSLIAIHCLVYPLYHISPRPPIQSLFFIRNVSTHKENTNLNYYRGRRKKYKVFSRVFNLFRWEVCFTFWLGLTRVWKKHNGIISRRWSIRGWGGGRARENIIRRIENVWVILVGFCGTILE